MKHLFFMSQSMQLSSLQPLSQQKKLMSKKKKTHAERVNAHLKDFDEKLQWANAQMEVENVHLAPEIDYSLTPKKQLFHREKQLHYGVPEQHEFHPVSEDLVANQYAASLDEKIDNLLVQEEVAEENFQKENEAYIKKFIENARRAGYRVLLDKNLKVKKVVRIRK